MAINVSALRALTRLMRIGLTNQVPWYQTPYAFHSMATASKACATQWQEIGVLILTAFKPLIL